MTDIFITGTWRKKWNADYNPKLEAALVAEGISCFLPQRDSNQAGERKEIFLNDIAGIENAKLLLAIGANNAQSSNWGVELGYAYATKKPVIILTDKNSPPDLMTAGTATEIIVPENIDDIQAYIQDLATLIRKLISPEQ